MSNFWGAHQFYRVGNPRRATAAISVPNPLAPASAHHLLAPLLSHPCVSTSHTLSRDLHLQLFAASRSSAVHSCTPFRLATRPISEDSAPCILCERYMLRMLCALCVPRDRRVRRVVSILCIVRVFHILCMPRVQHELHVLYSAYYDRLYFLQIPAQSTNLMLADVRGKGGE